MPKDEKKTDSLKFIQKESRELIIVTDGFVNEMKHKIAKKLAAGFNYWDKPEKMSDEKVLEILKKNIDDKDWVDVANLAMFLHHREGQVKKFKTNLRDDQNVPG